MVPDCFTNPQSALCPFSSSSDVFYSPFPHPFPAQTHGGTSPTNSGQTGAQGTPRMLPRLCEPPVIVLGGSSVSCRGSGLDQRKSALHVSQKGPLPPSRSSWHARQRHSRKPVTADSASLRAWRGFCTAPWWLCTLSHPLVPKCHRDHFSSTFSPHPSGEREPQTAVYCP